MGSSMGAIVGASEGSPVGSSEELILILVGVLLSLAEGSEERESEGAVVGGASQGSSANLK